MMELSRVDHKQMMVEKRGIHNTNLERVCEMDDDIVSSAWKHAAVCKQTAVNLRITAKITDEETHLALFLKMWETMQEERPELFTDSLIADALKIIDNAVNHEIIWGKFIIKDGVLGLTDKVIEDFVKHLADERLKAMRLPIQYNVKNPVSWFYDVSNINAVEENFFESKVSAYEKGALVWD